MKILAGFILYIIFIHVSVLLNLNEIDSFQDYLVHVAGTTIILLVGVGLYFILQGIIPWCIETLFT